MTSSLRSRMAGPVVAVVAAVIAATSLGVVGSADTVSAADIATFHGLRSARLMDTRPGSPTIDGSAAGGGAIGSNATADLVVVGRGGVPASGVGAVAVNVTATAPTATGYITVFPAGASRPTASNLNFTAGQTIPNMVIVSVGTGGRISIFNSSAGQTHVIVDVLGWFPAGGAYGGLTPARLLDTRPASPTIDGIAAGAGAVGANSATTFVATGRGGIPSSGVGAVALNVTATDPTLGGYLTVYPGGGSRPTASNVNFTTGLTIPNMVIVPLGASGQIDVFNGSGGTVHVVVDVLGWFPTGPGFEATKLTGLTPARLLDTRVGRPTIDGRFSGNRAIYSDGAMNLAIAGRGGVPTSGVGAVALNVTATDPTGTGYLTVYPTGSAPPTASNLNFVPGQTIPNMVIVPLGSLGQISIYNSTGTTDVIVDVLGWWPNPSDPPTSYGTAIRVTSTGITGTAIGSTTAAQFNEIAVGLFGTPTVNRPYSFPDFDPGSMSYSTLPSEEYASYAYPFGRQLCYGDYNLCADFGGMSASSLVLTGYDYFSDPQVRLLDVNGVGIGSRPIDFSGAISYSAGGCYSFGFGESSSGLHLQLYSAGTPFSSFDDVSMPGLPAPSDVSVVGFFIGQQIASEGDC